MAGMGATLGIVYTAGGLVIVVVAVFSLTLVPRTVEYHVNEHWVRMRQKLEEDMKSLVRASNMFMRAQWGEGELAQADEMIRRALGIYEPLAGARIWMAKEYHHSARTQFRQVHTPENLFSGASVPDLTGDIVQGLHWLREARRTQDAALVEIVAMESELQAMRGKAATPSVRGTLCEFNRLKEGHTEDIHLDPVVLLKAFSASESLLRSLEDVLGLKILLTAEEAERRLCEYQSGGRPVHFLAISKPLAPLSASVITPCKITFTTTDAGLWAQWPYVEHEHIRGEMFPRSDAEPDRAKPIGSTEMISELCQRFWLLSENWPTPTDYRDAPVTPVIRQVPVPNDDLLMHRG